MPNSGKNFWVGNCKQNIFMLGLTTSAPVKSMVANVNKCSQNYTWEVSYSKCLQLMWFSFVFSVTDNMTTNAFAYNFHSILVLQHVVMN